MKTRYELQNSSVEWSSFSEPCEKEYTFPQSRKELQAALKEALDECVKLRLQLTNRCEEEAGQSYESDIWG